MSVLADFLREPDSEAISDTSPRIYCEGLPLNTDWKDDPDTQYIKDTEPVLLEKLDEDQLSHALSGWASYSLPQELATDSPHMLALQPEVKEIFKQAVEHIGSPGYETLRDTSAKPAQRNKGKAREQVLKSSSEQQEASQTERSPSHSSRKWSSGTSASSTSTSGDSATTHATIDSSTSLESQAASKRTITSYALHSEVAVIQPKPRWGLTKFSKVFHRRGLSSASSSTPPTVVRDRARLPPLALDTGETNSVAATFRLELLMDGPQSEVSYPPNRAQNPTKPRACQTPIKRTEDILSPNLLTGTYECASCMDDIPGRVIVKLDCTHTYCRECFSQMIVSLSQNEIQWPPRCCLTDIPRQMIVRHLSPEELKAFHQKEKEYSVKAADRWYCTNVPACGKFFIPSRGGRDTTTCDQCAHEMCIMCRGAAHSNNEGCNEDLNLRATLDRAEQEGWRSCTNCSAIIERTAGCRHMTCTCGHQFCFICLARWRTCECTDEDITSNRRKLARKRAQAKQDQKTHDRQWQFVRETLDRTLAEQGRFDEEGRDFEAALAQIAQQQQADLDERARVEEEEAERMESSRREKIEVFSEDLQTALKEQSSQLLDALRARHEQQFSELKDMHSQIGSLESAGRARYHEKLDTHEKELQEVRQRHVDDMTAFRARVKKIVAVEVSKRRALQMDGSDLDFTLAMYDAAASYFDALEAVQHEELQFLQNCHERALVRIASTTQNHISQLLSDMDTDGDVQPDKSAPIIEKCANLVEQKTIQLATRAVADLKWLQTINGLVTGLCQERVEQLLSSGADAPLLGLISVQDELPEVISVGSF